MDIWSSQRTKNLKMCAIQFESFSTTELTGCHDNRTTHEPRAIDHLRKSYSLYIRVCAKTRQEIVNKGCAMSGTIEIHLSFESMKLRDRCTLLYGYSL